MLSVYVCIWFLKFQKKMSSCLSIQQYKIKVTHSPNTCFISLISYTSFSPIRLLIIPERNKLRVANLFDKLVAASYVFFFLTLRKQMLMDAVVINQEHCLHHIQLVIVSLFLFLFISLLLCFLIRCRFSTFSHWEIGLFITDWLSPAWWIPLNHNKQCHFY